MFKFKYSRYSYKVCLGVYQLYHHEIDRNLYRVMNLILLTEKTIKNGNKMTRI